MIYVIRESLTTHTINNWESLSSMTLSQVIEKEASNKNIFRPIYAFQLKTSIIIIFFEYKSTNFL